MTHNASNNANVGDDVAQHYQRSDDGYLICNSCIIMCLFSKSF
jgi:hypothetical protein